MADLKVIGSTPPADETMYDENGRPTKGYSIIYTYENGRTEKRFFYADGSNKDTPGVLLQAWQDDKAKADYEKEQREAHPPPPQRAPQTPEEQRTSSAQATEAETRAASEAQLERERQYNDSLGRGHITHEQYATQQLAQEREQRQQEQTDRQRAIDERNAKAQEEANAISRGRLAEEVRSHQAAEKGHPAVVGTPTETTKYVSVFDPSTGGLTRVENPAYDQTKDDAQKERDRITTEIAQRRISLDEGVQQYKEWFDQNVRLPFMQADEARAKAQEQRQALDAEERRRQFAANFGLQKAELGQKGSQMMIQAEESLLPYRAGPDEAADMSSAINSLAAGGSLSNNAAAGINFKASDFQFAAPNFAKIAQQGAENAIGHLTDYRPSGQQYSTADYSGINLPTANTTFSASAGGKYQPPQSDVPINSGG